MYNDNLHQPVAFHISLLLIASCFHPFITLFFLSKGPPFRACFEAKRSIFTPRRGGKMPS